MDLSGVYLCTMHTPIGEREIRLTLTAEDDGRLTGTLEGDHGLCTLRDGAVLHTGFGGTYLFFSCMPHDSYLDFCGRVEPDGRFYGANFHKGHTSEFTGKKQ